MTVSSKGPVANVWKGIVVAVLVTVKLPMVTVVGAAPVTDPVTKALPVDGSRMGAL